MTKQIYFPPGTTKEFINIMIDQKPNLPPRKRAKTKEEKEQRRVERILRNRRAAHASREKKRKYVEYLEGYINKLQNNFDNLNQNFEKVKSEVPNLDKFDFKPITDLSDFKLESSSRKRKILTPDNSDKDDNSEEETNLSDSEKGYEEDGFMKSSPSDLGLHHDEANPEVKQEGDFGSMNNEFNLTPEFYLSPISINSPNNDSIDLSLHYDSKSLMEQNSAVICFN